MHRARHADRVADVAPPAAGRHRREHSADQTDALVSGDGDHRGVADRPAREHRDVGGPATDVHDAHAEFLLIVGEHGEAGGQLLEHDVLDDQPAALHALDDVLRRAVRTRDDVHLGFQAHPRHADRIADPFLPVDDEFLRQHVEDPLVGGYGHRLGRLDHVLDVGVRDLAVADRDHAVGVQAPDVAAGDAGVDRVDLAAGHQLGLLDRALDGLHGRFDVDDHALLQAARGLRAQADDLDRSLGRELADQRDHLGGADVQSHDHGPLGALSHPSFPSLSHRPPPAGWCRCASRRRSRCCNACPRRRCRRRAG